jgi:hypothetical protein
MCADQPNKTSSEPHALLVRRRDERRKILIRAICHFRATFAPVEIVDISKGGYGMSAAPSLQAGDLVEIVLLNGRKLPGSVRWWINGRCGVQFTGRLEEDDPLILNQK